MKSFVSLLAVVIFGMYCSHQNNAQHSNSKVDGCTIDVMQFAKGKLTYGITNKENAKQNLIWIRKALEEAKTQKCNIKFPNKTIELSPVFEDEDLMDDFVRVKNSGKQKFIRNNDYYSYAFLDFTGFEGDVEGQGVEFVVDGIELYDIILNKLVNNIDGVCIKENSKSKLDFQTLLSLSETEKIEGIRSFVEHPLQIHSNCNKRKKFSSRKLLSQDKLEPQKSDPNKISDIQRILRTYWFSVIQIQECQAEQKIRLKDFKVHEKYGAIISDKGFQIDDKQEGIHELINGIYITNCTRPAFDPSKLNDKIALEENALLINIDVSGLGNGVKIQSSKNVLSVNLNCEGFTDTGFNLNASKNCWLFNSRVAGGNDGNCSIYGGNVDCGFQHVLFEDIGRSYQLAVIEGSDNCTIRDCKTKKSTVLSTDDYIGNFIDPNANHRAIIINRSSNSMIEKNEINGSETGITIRNTDGVDRFVFDPKVKNHCTETYCVDNTMIGLVNRLDIDGKPGVGATGIVLETSNNNYIMGNTIDFASCGTFVQFADRGKMDPYPYQGHCTKITGNTVSNLGPDIIDFNPNYNHCQLGDCNLILQGLTIEDNQFYNLVTLANKTNTKSKSTWGYSRYAIDFMQIQLQDASIANNTFNNIKIGNCNNSKKAPADYTLTFVGAGTNISFENNENLEWNQSSCHTKSCVHSDKRSVLCN